MIVISQMKRKTSDIKRGECYAILWCDCFFTKLKKCFRRPTFEVILLKESHLLLQ